jgi:hypothetical protein
MIARRRLMPIRRSAALAAALAVLGLAAASAQDTLTPAEIAELASLSPCGQCTAPDEEVRECPLDLSQRLMAHLPPAPAR